MPATVLRVLDIGKETTWGTPVTPTRRVIGVRDASASAVITTSTVVAVGNLSPAQLGFLGGLTYEGSIDGSMTYEELFWLRGIFGDVTPQGTGPYTWTYAAPLTSFPSSYFYTLQLGTTGACYKFAGGILNSLRVSIEAGREWQCSSGFLAASATSATPTSLTEGEANVVLASDTAVYIDPWGGTMGSTEVSATLISATLDLRTGRHLKQFVGDYAPGGHGDGRWEGSLALQLEFNSTAKAYVDDLVGGTLVQKQVELRATSGSNSLKLQFCGTLSERVALWEDRDGNMVTTLTFNGTYHPDFGNWLKFVVTNSVASYP